MAVAIQNPSTFRSPRPALTSQALANKPTIDLALLEETDTEAMTYVAQRYQTRLSWFSSAMALSLE